MSDPTPPPDPPPAGFGARFQRLRIRRGAPPRDAVPRMEHFHVTAAEKRRRQALERTRGRLVIAAGVFAAMFAVVTVRVAWVTVLNPVQAKVAHKVTPPIARGPLKPITETMLPGQRAMIVDRMGQPLAMSQPTRSVFADPTAIGDPMDAALKLKTVLPRLDVQRTAKKLSDLTKRFVYLERQITPDEEARINNLGIPSVDFTQTQQRHYPMGRVAAHVIGGVDIDELGVAGVEKAFDQRIRDNGQPLRLSLDVRVQNVVREELLAAKQEFSAIGAAGLIMDVNTGEVLAMVSLPDYDANAFRTAGTEERFNRTTTGTYEPGSTFKLQTASMGLDSGAIHIWDSFDAANPIHIGRFTITDFEGKHRILTLPEVLAYSSNLGAARIAHIMGGERQRTWLRNMGMFQRVPIELPEASRPLFRSEATWGEAVNYTVGFGHGISVTPLHVVVGTAAVANGGLLMRPTILAAEPGVRPEGTRPEGARPEGVRPEGTRPEGTRPEGTRPEGTRVMNQSTSDTMRRLMRLVVTSGFSKKADVAGFYPGGKTGTAEKNSGHGYKKHANVSAWMGVFPMQAPRFAVYMMLDEPHGTAATGGYSTAGQVAAPAAGRVISRIGPILGLMPDIQNMPAIEQALAIPLAPPRGMVLGPIRVAEPSSRPPAVLPARIPAGPPQPDLMHKTKGEPIGRPAVRETSLPGTSLPGTSHPGTSHPGPSLPGPVAAISAPAVAAR